MSRLILIAFLLFLASCGRPLTPNERAFSATVFADQIDLSRVRFVRGHMAETYSFRYQSRPRTTCMERIYPPPETQVITTSPAAITLFNKVFYRKNMFLPDYGYAVQGKGNLYALMLFAHEMTHVWQWQNRERTGYSPIRAAQEHVPGHDPYLFDLSTRAPFLSYPYEQQAAIVEEYVCCRALAPKAARTRRLHQMIAQALPLADIARMVPRHAFVPWKEAQIQGICE